MTVLLRRRPGAPDPHDFEHWQDTPPGRRKFLSFDEYAEAYGSTDEDVKGVIEFLHSKDLHVIESDAKRHRIVVEGTVAKIDAAFAITLNRYRAPYHFVTRPGPKGEEGSAESRTIKEVVYRGFEGPVHLPSGILERVRAVIGLDDRRLGGPAGVGTGDPPEQTTCHRQPSPSNITFPTPERPGKQLAYSRMLPPVQPTSTPILRTL